jgi:hypothetical protein
MVKPNVDFMQNYRPTPNRIFDLYNYYQGLGPTTGTPTTTTAIVPGYNPFIPRGGDGGGGITSIDPSGFRQTDNLFQAAPVAYENELSFQGKVPGMDIPAINFKDAPVDFMLRENNPRTLDPLVNAKNAIQGIDLKRARDFGLKALSSNLLSQGGAQLGFGIAGFPGALAGMIGGGILGFGARGPTDAERVVGNFYGNQGNQPMFYRDPITGELVESAMQGYNISSAYGKGIGAAIDKRLARIGRTIQKKKGKVTQGLLDLQARLKAEKEALAAEQQRQARNMQDRNRAEGTGGYQSSFAKDTDFMEGDKSAGGRATTATMGSF